MLLRELFDKPMLVEGPREDKIASIHGKKLMDVYAKKNETGFDFTDPNSLVEYMSEETVPNFVQWVVVQYINEPDFKLSDLPDVKDMIEEYNAKKITASFGLLNDLNRYTYSLLKEKLSELKDTPYHVNKLMKLYNKVMEEQVALGNGEWKFKSSRFNVYTPLNYNGSKALRECSPNDISLCTTYIDNSSHYDNYSSNGVLDYVLTPNMLYLAFFSRNPEEQESEFADKNNNHESVTQIIGPLFKKHLPQEIEIATDVNENIMFLPFTNVPDDEAKQRCDAAVKKDWFAIKDVPTKFIDRTMAENVVSRSPNMLRYIPKKMRNEELCTLAISINGSALSYVPPKLRTKDMCEMAYNTAGNYDKVETVEEIPEKFRDQFTKRLYKNAFLSLQLARFKQKPVPEAEEVIANEIGFATNYAEFMLSINHKIPQVILDGIAKVPNNALWFIKNVTHTYFPELEPNLAKWPDAAATYMKILLDEGLDKFSDIVVNAVIQEPSLVLDVVKHYNRNNRQPPANMEQALLSSDYAGEYVNWFFNARKFIPTSIFTNYVGKSASPDYCKLFAWEEQRRGKVIPKVIIQGILRGQLHVPYEYAEVAVNNNWPVPKEIQAVLTPHPRYGKIIDPAHGYVDPSYDFYGGDYSPEEDDNENDNDPEDDELNRVKQLAERLNR